jgi:hypothetical protein
MATLEQDQSARVELKGVLDALIAVDIPSLARRDELGSMSFEPGMGYFERALKLYRELSRLDIETVPFELLNALRDRATETLNLIQQIREFSFAKFPNNTQAQRDSLINQFRDRYAREFAEISPVIAYGIRRGVDFDRLESEAKRTVASMNALLENEKKTQEQTAETVKQTLDDIRKLAREAGVSQHAELFNQEAENHNSAAASWLTATAWTAGITTLIAGGLLWWAAFYTPNDISTAKAVQMGIAKIAILSLLFSAVLWVGRMYRSHRHNYVVNRHRLNALRTFETFARAAGDDATKNAVLIQATQCIFAPQQTGYVSNESEANPTSQVLEIVRTASKAGN